MQLPGHLKRLTVSVKFKPCRHLFSFLIYVSTNLALSCKTKIFLDILSELATQNLFTAVLLSANNKKVYYCNVLFTRAFVFMSFYFWQLIILAP